MFDQRREELDPSRERVRLPKERTCAFQMNHENNILYYQLPLLFVFLRGVRVRYLLQLMFFTFSFPRSFDLFLSSSNSPSLFLHHSFVARRVHKCQRRCNFVSMLFRLKKRSVKEREGEHTKRKEHVGSLSLHIKRRFFNNAALSFSFFFFFLQDEKIFW